MRTVKADLHYVMGPSNAWGASRDKSAVFNATIDMVSEKLGRGGVLGLINTTEQKYEAFCELPGYERRDFGNALVIPEKDIMVVKGQEVTTTAGNLIVLGLSTGIHLESNKTLGETILDGLDQNGILLVPCPFGKDGLGPYLVKNPALLARMDGLEVHNSLAKPLANQEAQQFFNQLLFTCPNLAAMAGSNGEMLSELGTSYTNIKMASRYENIQDAGQIVTGLKSALMANRIENLGDKREEVKKKFSTTRILLSALGQGKT